MLKVLGNLVTSEPVEVPCAFNTAMLGFLS
jgi:hypothetical protein